MNRVMVTTAARCPLHRETGALTRSGSSSTFISDTRRTEQMFAIDVYTARKREVVMGSAMPFSRYKTADSSLMEAMRAAFYRVCGVLELSCDREDPLTEVVVTKIVELARAGERDPEKLCNKVLADLETPAPGATSREPPERAPLPMASVAAE
jgi:hypothetical protein